MGSSFPIFGTGTTPKIPGRRVQLSLEPLWARLGANAADEPETMSQFDWSNVLSSTVPHFRARLIYGKILILKRRSLPRRPESRCGFRWYIQEGIHGSTASPFSATTGCRSPWIDASKPWGIRMA